MQDSRKNFVYILHLQNLKIPKNIEQENILPKKTIIKIIQRFKY